MFDHVTENERILLFLNKIIRGRAEIIYSSGKQVESHNRALNSFRQKLLV